MFSQKGRAIASVPQNVNENPCDDTFWTLATLPNVFQNIVTCMCFVLQNWSILFGIVAREARPHPSEGLVTLSSAKVVLLQGFAKLRLSPVFYLVGEGGLNQSCHVNSPHRRSTRSVVCSRRATGGHCAALCFGTLDHALSAHLMMMAAGIASWLQHLQLREQKQQGARQLVG